jgi:hypothetical protein
MVVTDVQMIALQFPNRARPRARSLTVTGLNRPIGRKRMNQVCSATVLAHTLQFEHEHDDENEHDSSRATTERVLTGRSPAILLHAVVALREGKSVRDRSDVAPFPNRARARFRSLVLDP